MSTSNPFDLPINHPDQVDPVQLRLPEFEGRTVRIATLKLTGQGTGYVGAHVLGEELILVVKARVAKVNHIDDPETLTTTREHTGKIAEAFIVPEGLDPAKLFDQAQEFAMALEDIAGKGDGELRLPLDEPDVDDGENEPGGQG